MKWLYSKEEKSKLVGVVLFNDNEITSVLNGNIFFDYPALNDGNTAVSNIEMINPSWTGVELIDKGTLINKNSIGNISKL